MTSEAETYITPEVEAYIGTESPPLVSPPVSESEIRRFAMAAYWPEVPPRRFWDAEYAKSTRFGGIVAPDEFNPFGWMVGRAHIGPQPTHIDEAQGGLGRGSEFEAARRAGTVSLRGFIIGIPHAHPARGRHYIHPHVD